MSELPPRSLLQHRYSIVSAEGVRRRQESPSQSISCLCAKLLTHQMKSANFLEANAREEDAGSLPTVKSACGL